jgi:hypothetical protein
LRNEERRGKKTKQKKSLRERVPNLFIFDLHIYGSYFIHAGIQGKHQFQPELRRPKSLQKETDRNDQ